MKLELLATFPGFRVLAWHEGYLYAAKGYRLFRMEIGDWWKFGDSGSRLTPHASRFPQWEEVGFYRPDWLRGLAAKNRFSTRLLRAGFHAVYFLPSGRIVAILAKTLAVLDPGEREFKTVWRVERGTRPMGMAVTPEGWLFWGEYFGNPHREEVYIYGSVDGGNNWEVVYTFPKGTIRHVHNVLYDPWDDCLWVLTGDEEKEPRILKVDKEWRSIEVVKQGSQQARAVCMFFEQDVVYYATDTPHEQNHIYRMERSTGRLEEVARVSGPSMWSCKAGGCMFFSTASEPGETYYPAACLWGSKDGDSWCKLLEWSKDGLHPEYFQFGNIVLPRGETPKGLLAATGVAVKGMDGWMIMWMVRREP